MSGLSSLFCKWASCFLPVENIIQLIQCLHGFAMEGNINSGTEHSYKLSRQIKWSAFDHEVFKIGEHPDKTVCTSTHHHFLDIMHTTPPLHLPETFVQSWWWMERPTRTIAESGTEESSHVSVKIKKLQSLTIPVQSHPGPQFIQFVFQSLDVSKKNAGNWGMVLSFSGSFSLFLQGSFHSGKVSHLHSLKSMLVWSQIVNAVKCLKRVCLS